jgi:hypothetical protein
VPTRLQVPRKFKLYPDDPEHVQLIWMEHRPGSPSIKKAEPKKKKKKVKITVAKETNLMPKKVNLAGLRGKDLILARRKMAKPKFLV